MKKLMIVLAAVAASMLLVCGHASAIPMTPFQMYTPYGNPISADPSGPLLAELDWLPGAGLAVNANAQGPGTTDNPFELLYQIHLGAIKDVKNQYVSDPTLNGIVNTSSTPYEFTAVGRMWENATDLGGWASNFSLAADPTNGTKPNMLEIYADKYDGTAAWGQQANVGTGAGYNDGHLVLQATPIHIEAVFDITDTSATGSPGDGIPDNQDYGTGSVQTIYQVDWFDPAFFSFPPADGPPQIQIQFDATLTLPPAGVDTPTMWDGTPTDYYTPLVAGTRPDNTNDLLIKVDGNSHSFVSVPPPPIECRMTGGGVTEDGEILLPELDKKGILVEGTAAEADDEMAEALDSIVDRYQFGGQVGAPTASQPQPYGEWTHHQQKGPMGMFTFHAGTASAPVGTEIDTVTCSDPGWCAPAREAPAKQIDFEGVGTFKNVQSGPLEDLVVPDKNKVKRTLHYFRVHVEDIGEPGPGGKQPKSPISACTHVIGTPVNPEAGDCENCADVYQIEIYGDDSPEPGEVPIYSVGGFIDNGNLQIHPPINN